MEGKFVIIFALSSLAAFSGIAVAQDSAAAPEAEAPFADAPFAFPPEPYAGFYENTEKCWEKINFQCDKELFEGVLDKAPVSKDCCLKFVSMGQDCRDMILEEMLLLPGTSTEKKMKIVENEAMVWGSCMAVADMAEESVPAGAPNPFSA